MNNRGKEIDESNETLEEYLRSLVGSIKGDDWQIWIETEDGSGDRDRIFTIKDIKDLLDKIDRAPG